EQQPATASTVTTPAATTITTTNTPATPAVTAPAETQVGAADKAPKGKRTKSATPKDKPASATPVARPAPTAAQSSRDMMESFSKAMDALAKSCSPIQISLNLQRLAKPLRDKAKDRDSILKMDRVGLKEDPEKRRRSEIVPGIGSKKFK